MNSTFTRTIALSAVLAATATTAQAMPAEPVAPGHVAAQVSYVNDASTARTYQNQVQPSRFAHDAEFARTPQTAPSDFGNVPAAPKVPAVAADDTVNAAPIVIGGGLVLLLVGGTVVVVGRQRNRKGALA